MTSNARRGGGYSPRGYRPEPTETPPTPAPISPDRREAPDAFADMSERITTLHAFVKARAGEQAVVTPTFWESIGYALGRAEAYLDTGDIVGAARQLGWFRTEARRWSEHPEFPFEAAR